MTRASKGSCRPQACHQQGTTNRKCFPHPHTDAQIFHPEYRYYIPLCTPAHGRSAALQQRLPPWLPWTH